MKNRFKLALFKLLPKRIRRSIQRSKINVNYKFLEQENIVIKIAETQEEITQAFSLVQKMYESANIVNKNSSGLRITKYHLLPTTKVIVAKYGEKVIGTLTQVMDTPLGLPIQEMIPLDELRKKSRRLCEISSLAIDKEWRSKANGLFFPLTIFAINYSRLITGADYLVIVTNDRVRYLYEDVFLFEPMNVNSQEYESVNDKNAFAQKLNLDNLDERYFNSYQNAPEKKNLFTMLSTRAWLNQIDYCIINREYNVVPFMHYDEFMLNSLFEANTMLGNLNDNEKQVVYNMYSIFSEDYGMNLYISKRRFPRYYANMRATLEIEGEQYETECLEFSRGGGQFILPEIFPVGPNVYKITMFLNEDTPCVINAKVSWTNKNKIGFEVLIDGIENWYGYMDKIENGFSSIQNSVA